MLLNLLASSLLMYQNGLSLFLARLEEDPLRGSCPQVLSISSFMKAKEKLAWLEGIPKRIIHNQRISLHGSLSNEVLYLASDVCLSWADLEVKGSYFFLDH